MKMRPKVVAVALHRFASFRSVFDAANVLADFDKKGILLVAIAENFDMTNVYGRAMAQMASVFAELERAMIRERPKPALRVKRSRGFIPSYSYTFADWSGPEDVLTLSKRYLAETQAIVNDGLAKGYLA
jgi:DNA invertase Pin-like site-specific DNA recombinase